MNPRQTANVADPQEDEVLAILNKLKANDLKNAEKKKAQNRSIINDILGKLEVPSGRDPFQNAWLTLTLGYELRFLDSRLRTGKFVNNSTTGDTIVEHKELGFCARDLDDFLFPILDWNSDAKQKFVKRFQQGESIWNHQFLIVPPADFDRLDYQSPSYPGHVLRPNIICLFRMVYGGRNTKTFNVVRINPTVFEDPKYQVPNYLSKKTKPANWGFRSHEEMLTEEDVSNANLGHELGHAINEQHILALKGDAQCKIDPNLDRCYGLTPEERRNIMGVGKEITMINAKPWLDHLQQIAAVDPIRCALVMLTDPKLQPLPPKKIPLAKAKPTFSSKR